MPAVRFLISGRVQGVGFRASTRDAAVKLGIDACHASNLPDGRVEVLALGHAAALDALQAWLHEGPPLAPVDGVMRKAVETDEVPPGFRLG